MMHELRPRFLKLSLIFFLVALTGLSACSGDDSTDPGTSGIQHPQDFLPPATSNMAAGGDPRLATDASSLQDIINGGYTEFVNHGFQEMATQEYNGTVGEAAASVTAFIYDLTTSANASYILDAHSESGTWQMVADLGDEAVKNVGFVGTQLLMRKAGYYVDLYITSTSSDAQTLLESWATHIDQEID